jgi:PKD repeat protein
LSVLEFWITPFNYAHPDGPQVSALAELAPGDTIGMGYAILDWDKDESEGAHFWALADTVLMYCNADFLADFVLAPLEQRLERLPLVDFRSRAPQVDDPRAIQFANHTKGEVADFLWDFGDGENSAEQEPLHRYGAPGSYTVTLEAKNQWGTYRKRKVDYVVLHK